MAVPATTGVLRTKVSEMDIGDYITIRYDFPTGLEAGTFKELGGSSVPLTSGEVPVSGIASGNGFKFYLVKVAKGLLVADRVPQNTITWDKLNSAKYIQGLPFDAGNIIPTMTSNNSPSGVAIASKESVGNEGWKAFDNSPSTYWVSYPDNVPTSPAWMGYDFGISKKIKSYGLTCSFFANNAPKDWTFEGSNDGATWTVLDERKGITTINTTLKKFKISNPQEFHMFRLNIKAITGSSATYVCINQLEMYDTEGIIRSLTGGVAYADANGNKSLASSGSIGGWPQTNEWDRYIVNYPVDKIQVGKAVNDVFHAMDCQSWVQDTPDIAISVSSNRVRRGGSVGVEKMYPTTTSNTSNTLYGFRPVFEYKE